MKFKINRTKFLDGLKAVQNIVAGKGTLQIIQNVLIETSEKSLRLTTTDLDISMQAQVECEVEEAGVSTLPVKYLASIITQVAEGEVNVEVDSMEHATIVSGNAKFKLVGLPASDFPKLPEDEEAYAYRIPEQTLREMLRKVSYAASQDDTRRTLKGVLVSFKDQKVTMVATDGRRLAMVESELEFSKTEERDIVLTTKSVGEIMRSLNGDGEVELMIRKSQICLKLANLVIFAKLIDDVYPNYQQVIPQSTLEHIVIDRQLLIDALERAKVLTIDEAHSTKLIFSPGKLTVTSAASDIGEAKDEVPIKYAGETVEILFNPNYVMDPLKVITDDEISINLNDGHSPVIIRCSIPFLYVLMPLRVS